MIGRSLIFLDPRKWLRQVSAGHTASEALVGTSIPAPADLGSEATVSERA